MFEYPDRAEVFLKWSAILFNPKLELTFQKYDVEKYRQFINTFGTHYIKEANMGALYGQQSTISSESWGRMVNQNLDISASASAAGKIILPTHKISVKQS